MNNKTIIFGCGYHGRAAFRKCIAKNFKVIYWLDNNKKLIGKKYFDLRVVSPKNLTKIHFDQIILCGRNIDDQKKQLKNLKIKKKIKIWNFFDLKPEKKKIIQRDKKLYQLLKFVISKLNLNNINYWADTSGLLTLIRKDNISLLSDFDIAVDYKNINKVFKIFKSSKLIKVVKHNNIIKKKRFSQISLKSINNMKIIEPAIVDFSFYKKIKKTYYKFDNVRKKFPASYLNIINFIKYKKLKIKVPGKSNDYLENIYGKTFRKKVKFYTNPLKYKTAKSETIYD